RFEGQVTVFKPGDGPCYRCLFPEPPPAELAPSCAEGGVLGVLPGIVGTLQTNEALKLALGIGEPLIGRLLLIDALAADFSEVQASGATVRELLEDLSTRLPALGERIYDGEQIRPFVNVYVDGEDVRTLGGLDVPVRDDSTVVLLPAMAGGCGR